MWCSIYMNYIVFLTAEGEEKWIVMKALSSSSEKPVKPPVFVFKCLQSGWQSSEWHPWGLAQVLHNLQELCLTQLPCLPVWPQLLHLPHDLGQIHQSQLLAPHCLVPPNPTQARPKKSSGPRLDFLPLSSTEHTAPVTINHPLKWEVTE